MSWSRLPSKKAGKEIVLSKSGELKKALALSEMQYFLFVFKGEYRVYYVIFVRV